jgi:hypothetical protein
MSRFRRFGQNIRLGVKNIKMNRKKISKKFGRKKIPKHLTIDYGCVLGVEI